MRSSNRSFRRAASKMRLKRNKDRANEEFVRSVNHAVHDRLVLILQSFPELDTLPQFYQDIVDILWGVDRIKKSLGAIGWAARWARNHGPGLAYQTRKAPDPSLIRKRAVARLSSVVHQIDDELRFLNDVRNVLHYEMKILEDDPFATIDTRGVGALMRIGVEKGRGTRTNLKIGVCGEHGGDPASVEFCHAIGLDYVSCSPYREVPIARLAAGRAGLADAPRTAVRPRKATARVKARPAKRRTR